MVLQTLSQQYQMNGRYVCRVSNGISGPNSNVFQKGIGSFSYSGKINVQNKNDQR